MPVQECCCLRGCITPMNDSDRTTSVRQQVLVHVRTDSSEQIEATWHIPRVLSNLRTRRAYRRCLGADDLQTHSCRHSAPS